jgi:hypothetical protein
MKTPEPSNLLPVSDIGAIGVGAWPFFADDEIEAAVQVLRSGKVNYWTGEEGRLFEKEFAAFVECEHAVAMVNGTAALECALKALGSGFCLAQFLKIRRSHIWSSALGGFAVPRPRNWCSADICFQPFPMRSMQERKFNHSVGMIDRK